VEVSRIIAEIDSQISKLQQARALLADTSVTAAVSAPSRRGRPKGSKNLAAKTAKKVAVKAAPSATKTKRKLSPEGRKRIAESMKKRWAERRKQVSK
jgi:hypothetical protein